MNCVLDLETDGRISLQERHGESAKASGYTSTTLIDTENGEISLTVALDEDEWENGNAPGIKLSLLKYHLENTETGRAFHANLDSIVPWADVERLRDFLTFLLGARTGAKRQ